MDMQKGLSVANNHRGGHSEVVPVADGIVLPMHWCPAGRFVMGTAGAGGDEQPHEVTLTRGFWIARFPVTQEIWQAVMHSEFRFRDEPGSQRLPVEAMSYETALRFCDELERHWRARAAIDPSAHVTLPTEAQWEYACRAGTTTLWWFGDDPTALAAHAWYRGNSEDQAHPVELKPPNPWGLADLYGNVAEWCLDDLRLYGPEAVMDPLHAEGGRTKIVRGGGYTSPANDCRSASRGSLLADNPYSEETGIRVVVAAPR
jgi:formylglycine-generating enzyme required for sulfatase activity